MKFVEPIGLNRKFGAIGHPSMETDKVRILGFYTEMGTADRLTIQTVARLHSYGHAQTSTSRLTLAALPHHLSRTRVTE